MIIYIIIYTILFFYSKYRLKNMHREDIQVNQAFWGDYNFIFEKTIIGCFYLLMCILLYILALGFYYPEVLESLINELQYFQKVEGYISYIDYIKESSLHLKIVNFLTILPFYLPIGVSFYFIVKKLLKK